MSDHRPLASPFGLKSSARGAGGELGTTLTRRSLLVAGASAIVGPWAWGQTKRQRPIVLGQVTLSFYAVTGAVVHEVLERLGHSVEVRQGPHEEMFPLLGQGAIDLMAAVWLPEGHAAYWARVTGGETHAVLWTKGILTDLGTLGGSFSSATDINPAGQVVGGSWITPGQFVSHAFLWVKGVMTDLGTLGGASSFASGINPRGQVVGYSDMATGETHAFIWENGVMTDLGAGPEATAGPTPSTRQVMWWASSAVTRPCGRANRRSEAPVGPGHDDPASNTWATKAQYPGALPPGAGTRVTFHGHDHLLKVGDTSRPLSRR
jgi:probable HAF family extracellular repeat protein